jgi:hypothetical protein
MATMTIFSEGDTLTLPASGDTIWAVRSVRRKTSGATAVSATAADQRDNPADVLIGLVDSADPNHGTALNAATLADCMRDYRKNPIVALVDQLAADLVANGVAVSEARPLAGRLVIAGWKR